MLKITWKNDEAKNSVDLIDDAIFLFECDSILIEHSSRTPDGNICRTKCLVTCMTDWAILDYEHSDVKAFNEANEISPGSVLIEFANSDRKEIENIKWSENSEEFYNLKPDPIWSFDDTASTEGMKKIKAHFVNERKPSLRMKKIAMAGSICEICEISHFSGTSINRIIDVHHQKPLSQGIRNTTLEELSVLCPTCHRAIHNAMRIKGDIVTVEEFKREYFST
jgi:predicted HNH restriction endonuclease